MFGKYILPILGVISLVWVAYVGLDLLVKTDDFNPNLIFGKEDQEIIVIHRPNEYQQLGLEYQTEEQALDLYKKLSPWINNSQLIILSKLRNHLYIETKQNWTRDKLKSLFQKLNLEIKFGTYNAFTVGEYSGKYHHNILYLTFNKSKTTTINAAWLKFDKKATASIINFATEQFTATDIYLTSKGQVQYISAFSKVQDARQLEDEKLFAHALPNQLKEYHFFEKNYYKTLDSVFSNGPMFDWMEFGLVTFKYEGEDVWISDFKGGQDPISSLHEFAKHENYTTNQQEANFSNIQLINGITTTDSFYVKKMDGFVVFSKSQNSCDQVVANYRLGNTLILNKKASKNIYGDLPKRVVERFVADNSHYSKTIYAGKIYETQQKIIDLNSLPLEPETISNNSISMPIGSAINDVLVLKGKGHILASTKNGELKYFKKGKLAWTKNLNAPLLGSIELIDFESSLGEVWMATTKNNIFCFDSLGNDLAGFPLTPTQKLIAPCAFIKHKNRRYFSFLLKDNVLNVTNEKLKLLATFKVEQKEVTQKPLLWVSRNFLLTAITGEEECVIFNILSKKELRSFPVNKNSKAFISKNEYRNISLKNDTLFVKNQRGIQQAINNYSGGSLSYHTDYYMVNTDSLLTIYNFTNDIKASIPLPFQDLEYIDFAQSPSGMFYIVALDGFKNNVYLHDVNGHQLRENPFKGQLFSKISWTTTNQMIITTVIDDYITQYIEN